MVVSDLILRGRLLPAVSKDGCTECAAILRDARILRQGLRSALLRMRLKI
jgi:hypothetical protein